MDLVDELGISRSEVMEEPEDVIVDLMPVFLEQRILNPISLFVITCVQPLSLNVADDLQPDSVPELFVSLSWVHAVDHGRWRHDDVRTYTVVIDRHVLVFPDSTDYTFTHLCSVRFATPNPGCYPCSGISPDVQTISSSLFPEREHFVSLDTTSLRSSR